MSDDSLKIDVGPQSSSRHSRKKGPSTVKVVTLLCLVLVALLVVFISLKKQRDSPVQNLQQGNKATETNQSETPTTDSLADPIVEQHERTLWISPTFGEPIDLEYVLLGSKLFFHFRPAALTTHPEGEKILEAIGPWGKQAITKVTELSGAKLSEVGSLLVSFYPLQQGGLLFALRLQLVNPWTDEQLAERLPDSEKEIIENQVCWISGEWSAFLPTVDGGRTLIVCKKNAASELILNGKSAPPLPRDLQRIVELTDAERIATLVFPSKFFQASGSELLQGSAKQLVSGMNKIVGEESTTIALSVHWDENFFLELQSTVALNKPPQRYIAAVAKRLSHAPTSIKDELSNMVLHPYGREVLIRLPEMLEELSNFTRVSSQQGISISRSYLPLAAGHNLLAATELLLNCTKVVGQEGNPASLVQNQKISIEAALERSTTLSFPKETLQKALELLSEDLKVPIELLGSDLQLEGITKNQSFAVDLRDRPAGDILLAILQRANPDRTATGPSDPRQKLVYIIRKATEGQQGAIVVTTRSAAENRGDRLPDVFQPAE